MSALSDSDGEPGGSGSRTCSGGKDDKIASFSNYGDAVDIAAPGGTLVGFGRKIETELSIDTWFLLHVW